MDRTNQLIIEPTLGNETVPAALSSTIKTILLHIQNDANLEARLQCALSLARATGAHLRCLHVTPIEAYVTMDSLGGLFVMDSIISAIDDEESRIRSTLEARLAVEDVTWDYEKVTGNTVGALVGRAALSDLVITGRQAHVERARSLEIGIIGDVLMGVRTPLLIPGDDDAVFDPFGPAVIAWNDSYEAANAVRNAVGLLKLSSDVRVIQLTDIEDEPPTHLLEYLSRHDIHAQVDTWIREDAVEDSLTDYAQQRAASYIVMGGYGHNRAGEFLFGGVTRSLLKASPVALALAH